MLGNRKGADILQRHTTLPATRWDYYAQADRSLVAGMDLGLLFLVAFWSGPALASFSRLTEALQSFAEEEIHLTVVDVDGADDLCRLDGLREIACLYGTGELVFIHGGQIRQIIRGGNASVEEYKQHIETFLADGSEA